MLDSIDLLVLPPTAGCSCEPCRLKPLVFWLKHRKNSDSETLWSKSLNIKAWLCQKVWWEVSFEQRNSRRNFLRKKKCNHMKSSPFGFPPELKLKSLSRYCCTICFGCCGKRGYPSVESEFPHPRAVCSILVLSTQVFQVLLKGQVASSMDYIHFEIPRFL